MHDLFCGNTPEALAARALMERREKTEKELANETLTTNYRPGSLRKCMGSHSETELGRD
jgi:hypothetical protein